MKLVIAVHEGHSVQGSLTGTGMTQAAKLAEAIEKLTQDAGRTALFTSPTKSSTETAMVIGAVLGIRPTDCISLMGNQYDDGEGQTRDMLELARALYDDYDTLIAVTQGRATAGIIDAFARGTLQKEAVGRARETMHGTGLCLSLGSGEISVLP